MEAEASPGAEPVPTSRWSRIPLPATGRLELLPFVLHFAGLGLRVGTLCRRRRRGMLLAVPEDDVPDEFPCTEGTQTEVLGPSALLVVAASSVQNSPRRRGSRGFIASLASRLHSCLALARTNPTFSQREAVAAWRCERWARTDGYPTANSQPAQQGSAARAPRDVSVQKQQQTWLEKRRRHQQLLSPRTTRNW